MEISIRRLTQIRTRKLDRLVAHTNMKRVGLSKVNKHDYNNYKTMSGMIMQEYIPSYFARHWRENVVCIIVDNKKK